ncbi:hypothetical protein F1D61_30150 [Methylobacterium aquaticum]|uniref:Uncharacterized protein n=1 Tax=Methylobacterium aquaticum TaxID=270351 RepID=A0A0C6FLC4_9HYPH|nr:hypothetical protein F1D61_30150 [Methylobacterium aquaticum]BAQ45969.1 hypothetical protein Maq22A_c13850 [Methylobacterium aquaticum]
MGSPEVFAMGHWREEPTCLVEQAVNAALADACREAEALLLSRPGDVTLGRLNADFHARLARRGPCGQEAPSDDA